MADIQLKYGTSEIRFEFDPDRFTLLDQGGGAKPLSDAEIGEKLDNPIDSKLIDEIVRPGESVLIVVPDATRQVACGQIVNIIVRRLIANGTASGDIRIIFATGLHRAVTNDEKEAILTPFIFNRIKTLDHGPRDITQMVRLGTTADGIPIELNRALIEHDHVILIGGVTFHYFAGFTGGRKLVCPGLASSKTISQTHRLAFDRETLSRRNGVGVGLLDGNDVHEAFLDVSRKINVGFCITTSVNEQEVAVDLVCGDWVTSHRKACETYAAKHAIPIKEKREIVIVSSGGYPHDINLIQAHKALETAAHACVDGGTIVLLAECRDGLGKADFLKWFAGGTSDSIAEKLCETYQVNGQTAWSLLSKTEKFEVKILTSLEDQETNAMHMEKVASLNEALAGIGAKPRGYIIPFGAKNQIVLDPPSDGKDIKIPYKNS